MLLTLWNKLANRKYSDSLQQSFGVSCSWGKTALVMLCLDYIVDLWVQRVCQVLFTRVLPFKAHGPPPVKHVDGKLHVLDLLELLQLQQTQDRGHSVALNTLRSPQVLTVESPCTGAMLPGSLVLDVPGQKRHQVVGGTKAALTLNGLGQADSKEQGWPNTHTNNETKPIHRFIKQPLSHRTFMESAAELGAAVGLELTCAACLSFCCILTALAPNTQLIPTALLILCTRLWERRESGFQFPNLSVTCHVSRQPLSSAYLSL